MYTVVAPVRSVLKDMRLPKGLWDLIAEAVVYVKNRTITSSKSDDEVITTFGSRVWTNVIEADNSTLIRSLS